MGLKYNENLILNLIKQSPGIGKTKLMKFAFFLQESFGGRVDSDFNIYTYGTYSDDIMGDLNSLIFNELICAEKYVVDKYTGYKLSVSDEVFEEYAEQLPREEQENINSMIGMLGEKTARDLELLSTVTYITNQFKKNNWNERDDHNIFSVVKDIKPHFSDDEIKEAHQELLGNGILRQG
ncbi:MAG: hypothetical protein FWB98_05220 [Defluviitaleaceae bacterium]|nr:hypothetical protein [Defluviitaleaceae bacterium]